jgi:ParB family chromosome partitioning protein
MTTQPGDDARRRQLGRGLSALMGDSAAATAAAPRGGVRMVPIGQIKPGAFQPRRFFDEGELADLVNSIKAQGVLQPILLRRDPANANGYELIAGERRWRAAQLARLHEIPALVKDLSDREALEVALVENLQRQDLTPLEEAQAYRRLMDEFSHTQEKLAAQVGKSRPHVANTLRLLDLPVELRDLLQQGSLSAGHARALLTAADPLALARRIMVDGLTVRQAEALAARHRARKQEGKPARRGGDSDTRALEKRLSEELGLKVEIRHEPGKESGVMTIRYKTLDQLDDLMLRLSRRPR